MLCPARLRGQAQRLAAVFWTDVPPTRSAKAYGLPFYWRRRQFPARDVEQFKRQVEQRLGGQSALADDSAQRHRSAHAEKSREFFGNLRGGWGASFSC